MQHQSNLLHGACRAEVDPAVLNLLITECPRSDLNSTDKVSLHGIVDVNSEGYKTTTFILFYPILLTFLQHGRTPLHVACAAIRPCMNDMQASLNPV